MKPRSVCVVRTGVANLASVVTGLERVGASPRVGNDPVEIANAQWVVLPGVGAFGAGMTQLRADGLVEPLRHRIAAGLPTLAVCLGLQLLCEGSEESPGVEGLGVVPGRVTRFPETLRVPQLGWNQVEPTPGCRLVEPGFAYFANSFRLAETPHGWRAAHADYGGGFVAALERGRVLACQFHPELSSAWGIALLKRWLVGERIGGGDADA